MFRFDGPSQYESHSLLCLSVKPFVNLPRDDWLSIRLGEESYILSGNRWLIVFLSVSGTCSLFQSSPLVDSCSDTTLELLLGC